MYVYAFVRPSDGETFWLFLPTVSTEAFQLALDEFAAFTGAGRDHQVVLVLDGAGWHTSRKLEVPEGLHLLFLPAYSPQLQPAERLWPLLHEAIANQAFDELDDMEAALERRCRTLMKDKGYLRRITEFGWWREALRPIV